MAKGNFPACLKITLVHEGGWADHPRDPGGATMRGVTLATYRQYKPGANKADLRAISNVEIQNIYRAGYWKPMRGDDLPAGVDLASFDYAVNSGPSRSARHLQSVVGAKVDGKVGPNTVAAVEKRSPSATVKALCKKRMGFLRGLSTFSTFGRGWSRRVAEIEAKGVQMALSGQGVGHVITRELVDAEAGLAQATAKKQDAAAKSAGGAGGVGIGTDLALNGEMTLWIAVGVATLALIVVAIAKSRANVNKDRAEAYRKLEA